MHFNLIVYSYFLLDLLIMLFIDPIIMKVIGFEGACSQRVSRLFEWMDLSMNLFIHSNWYWRLSLPAVT